MRRSHVLLAGGVALGMTGLLLGGGSGGTKAEIAGATIDSDEASPDKVEASLNEAAVSGAPAIKPILPAADLLDLEHLDHAGDRIEAKLSDGRHAILTLDPTLQAAAEKILADSRAPRAAIVAMAPDGRILALAGRHSDDPKGSLEGGFDAKLATDAWAPAASVFKLVTASALLTSGVKSDDSVCFHGGIRSVMESNLRDDKRDNQCKDLTFGVAHSNNAILGKLAYQHLAPDALDHFAKQFGFGSHSIGSSPMGIAAIPTQKDLLFAQAAAGFSGSQLSVIGGAMLAATFADDGEQPTPYLIASIDGVDAKPDSLKHRVVPVDVAREVKKMMVATCDIGSASRSFRHHAIKVAGKTGTLTRTDPFYMEHSWFVGYAPVEKPEIIVAVVLGNPENWHLRGQEAARRLIDKALSPTRASEDDRNDHRPDRPARAHKRAKDRS